jgi:hypothetical protein
MNKSLGINASCDGLFTGLSNAVSNSASILVGDARARYRALAGLCLQAVNQVSYI